MTFPQRTGTLACSASPGSSTRALIILLASILAACGAENSPKISRTPVSIRGWIGDIQPAKAGDLAQVVDTEQRIELYRGTNMSVDDVTHASGALAENGSFIILDVPPGNSSITFWAPGMSEQKLRIENAPPNADILIPGIVIASSGITIREPGDVLVRVPARGVEGRKRTDRTMTIAGTVVPIFEASILDLGDRRDYPQAGKGLKPIAIVR